MIQGIGRTRRDAQGPADGQRSVADRPARIGTGDVLHRDPQDAVGTAPIVHGHHMGMIQSRRDLGLTFERARKPGSAVNEGCSNLSATVSGKRGCRAA